MTDPNGWPAHAREAVRAAIYDTLVLSDPWACADAALAALAPFVAARLAEARREGMQEAAAFVEDGADGYAGRDTRPQIAAAILARAEASDD
jgi:hypothetical protein